MPPTASSAKVVPASNAKFVAKHWSAQDWTQNIGFAQPSSGGGQGGVIFVWVSTNKADHGNVPKASFVIKGVTGSAAPTRFAEAVLETVADAASTHTHTIPRNSDKGNAILAALTVIKGQAADQTRWNAVWNFYDKATELLVQDALTAAEMDKEYRKDGGLATLLQNETFLKGLGKLFVADAVIGNGDRMFKMNPSNILYLPDGTLCAIDSTTILANFEELLNECASASPLNATNRVGGIDYGWGGHGYNPTADVSKGQWQQDWATNQVKGLQPNLQIGTNASSFTMETLWEIDSWWTHEFRRALESGLNSVKPPLTQLPTEQEWTDAKGWFLDGADEGMKRVDAMFEQKSFGWLKFKFKFFQERRRFGSDPNMDWMNLKLRRKYYLARRAGKTQKEAEEEVVGYASDKFSSVWTKVKSWF